VCVSKYSSEDGELVPPKLPADGAVESVMRPFTKELRKRSFAVTPWTYEKYVETRPRNKVIYQNALQRLRRRGLQPNDGKLRVFIKAEKTANPDGDPRIISPRNPCFNIVVGSFILPLEHILYNKITRMFGSPTVMKGFNAKQSGNIIHNKWQDLAAPVAIGFDVHRMDQHVSTHLLHWEHHMYKLFQMPSSVARALKSQIVNEGTGYAWDGKLKFKIQGRRASGDVNTGLGNCLIMCSAVWSAMHGATYKWHLANNGDDCVFFVDRWNWPDAETRLKKTLATLCLPTEFETPVEELERVVFCQTQPVFDGEDWIMVRDPRTAIDKDSCTLKPLPSKKAWNTYRNSNSVCGLAAYGHMPVYKEFYAALGRGAGTRVDRDTVEDGLKRLSKGMKNQARPISVAARVSFYKAFGIVPSNQLCLERHYARFAPVWRTPRKGGMSVPEGVVRALMGCEC